MLRITDGRTNRPAQLPATRGGLLGMLIHLACADGVIGPPDVRALIVADVLFRAAEADGIQVSHVVSAPNLAPEHAGTLRQFMDELGIHPPAAGFTLPGDADVHVYGSDVRRSQDPGLWIEVGRIQQAAPAIAGPLEPDLADRLAVRLALLSRPYRVAVSVTSQDLADAARTLARWRQRVGEWAREPSKPIPAAVRQQASDALADDLGTRAVLALLRRVEKAPEIPPGAKFEIFAYLDRFLGLELAREIGRW